MRRQMERELQLPRTGPRMRLCLSKTAQSKRLGRVMMRMSLT